MAQRNLSSSLDAFRRDPEAPPADELGEASLLAAILDEPELLRVIDLTGLLTKPAHRAMWAAMQSVSPEHRGYWAEFFTAWRTILCEQQCADLGEAHEFWSDSCRAFVMWESLCDSRNAEAEWIEEQYRRAVQDDPRRYVHYHDWQWWLARVKACAEARQIIAAAQRMADAAWRVPEQPYELAEAQAALARVSGVSRSRFTLDIPA